MADTEDFSTLKERAKKKLERDMGPLLLGALNDPRTVEIMLNADGKLWQERLGEKMKCIGSLRVAQSEAIIKTIAGYHGKEPRRPPKVPHLWPPKLLHPAGGDLMH